MTGQGARKKQLGENEKSRMLAEACEAETARKYGGKDVDVPSIAGIARRYNVHPRTVKRLMADRKVTRKVGSGRKSSLPPNFKALLDAFLIRLVFVMILVFKTVVCRLH